ncbi:AAA family ATPase [bacterium]|nr:AAA family ATPase [bacterium]
MESLDLKKVLKSSRNLFITGPAGTGKSYILNDYIATHDDVIVCAPTGLAALNIGGDTIHKVFHVPVPAFGSPSFAKGKKGAITNLMLLPIVKANTVIIDEISMCRNDVFSYMVKVLRKAERIKGSKIRVIVCGDFSQLPPVVKKTEVKLMKKFGLHESGYAFTTPEWKSLNFKVVELTEVKRQDDAEFINVLNEIRVGNCDNLSYFDKFVKSEVSTDDSVFICGVNSMVDTINASHLDTLDGNIVALRSLKTGRCGVSFDNDLILLKVGARVVFIANDVRGNQYRNGMFGTIVSIDNSVVHVDIGGKTISVYRKEYPVNTYSVSNNKLCKKELGTIQQFPFKLGYAITIHKSQGQTFDNVVISPDIFAAGQLYVALSRVRRPDGLILSRKLETTNVIIDSVVLEFYKNNYVWNVKRKTTGKSSKTSLKKSVGQKSKRKSSSSSKVVSKKSTSIKKSKSTNKAMQRKPKVQKNIDVRK